jgi:glycosyltransferase involved in cell wall biosynthesis
MKTRISQKYGIRTDNVHVFSNVNLIDSGDNGAGGEGLSMKVGFFSNISEEKGISEFIELSRRVDDLELAFEIAGPIVDSSYDWIKSIEDISKGKIRWVGPLEEVEKAQFMARIDVLLFPTRYRNEAEPLVIYEAMAAGVVVVAYDRGCIREMLRPPHSVAADVDAMEATIRSLVNKRPLRSHISGQYKKERGQYEQRLPVVEAP